MTEPTQRIYKYIEFVREEKRWLCINVRMQDTIGVVEWYPTWRQYIYAPEGATVYSAGCLDNIKDFLDQLNGKRKLKSKAQEPTP